MLVRMTKPSGPPASKPVGLELTQTARVVSKTFDDALRAAGGSLPVWLVLVSVKGGVHGAQRDIADAIGVEGPTLTHHLNRLETSGLVTRTRDPQNRRTHRVQLTAAGDAVFFDLLRVVRAFDKQLTAGLSERDLSTLRRLLGRLRTNAEASADKTRTRTGT
jgi:MarR family transcriptional regulator, transcriptional regulator for hemolysin